MTAVRRHAVLSVYEGFFTGGARVLHNTVLGGLHTTGRGEHSVLSIHSEMRRETVVQRMEDDHGYRALHRIGVRITSLGRRHDVSDRTPTFTASERDFAAGQVARAEVILSLKEQPLHLLNQVSAADRPVIVCLHRSDPENQGSAMTELRTAIATGRVVAGICCAE